MGREGRARDVLPARLLTREEAAAYCGWNVETYDQHRRAGRVPAFKPGTRRIDLKQLDAALDAWDGDAPPSGGDDGANDLDAWRRNRKRGRDAGQGHQHHP